MAKYNFNRLQQVSKEDSNVIAKLWDIFAYSINEWEYMFGRVIYLNPKVRGCFYWQWLDTCVYYFYSVKSNEKYLKDFSILSLENLLLPPYISYNALFQTGYFEIIWNEEITDKNVYFPICFEIRECIIDWNWYRDVEDRLIDKQKWCWFPWLWNLYSIEREIIKALWETPPEYEDETEKKFFVLSDTNAWFDYLWKINWETKVEDLYKKIETEEYYIKNYDFDSYDALEGMVDIEVLIFTWLKRDLEKVDEDLFPWVYEFYRKYTKDDINKEIFTKAKKLLEIILKSKTSELKWLRQEAWRYLYLKKWIQKRTFLIDEILKSE